ncbi:Chitin-binding type-4 domain-containing protein [Fusarium sp. LHS14.1]|nr:Chitin-binding type-4 domain-containing protein [Fusarium sp. LHS14.1]
MKYAAALTLIPLVAAHGFVRSPPPRKPGDAFKAACGEQPFYQQSSDINGNVQGIFQVVGTGADPAKCNLWLCKGFQADDNTENVQTYSLGQEIDFDVNIAAPHTGYANVSVVKTSSNTVIGEPLIEFSNYASNAGVDANNTAFSVTLPSSLGGDCTTAGDCVLQWFWDAPDIDQTYESCVDFVVGSGSGSGNSGSSPSAPAASAPAASAPAASTPAATQAPIPTTLVAVTASTEAPAATAAPDTGAEEPVDDDEECPADDEEPIDDEEPVDDEECPADDEEPIDDEEPVDDEECPADEEYDEDY